jgi:hypothetical protein
LEGTLTAKVTRDGNPNPKSNQPPGTRSQEVVYSEGSNEVARVHQYMRSDGTLGGSGYPDPKTIYEGTYAFHLRRPPRGFKEKMVNRLSDLRDRICWAIGIEIDYLN